jgi:hypothetical protein
MFKKLYPICHNNILKKVKRIKWYKCSKRIFLKLALKGENIMKGTIWIVTIAILKDCR